MKQKAKQTKWQNKKKDKTKLEKEKTKNREKKENKKIYLIMRVMVKQKGQRNCTKQSIYNS